MKQIEFNFSLTLNFVLEDWNYKLLSFTTIFLLQRVSLKYDFHIEKFALI